jgi:hypothetical protein
VERFLDAVLFGAMYVPLLLLYLLVFCAVPAAIVCGAIALVSRLSAGSRDGRAGERKGDQDGLP